MLKTALLRWLRFWARLRLSRSGCAPHRMVRGGRVIGIGGAAGKTSLCLAVEGILATRFAVRATRGKNSESGVPLSILEIDPGAYRLADYLRAALLAPIRAIRSPKGVEWWILELGIDGPDEPKNMSWLLGLAVPDIAALASVGVEHSANFENAGDNAAVARRINDEEISLLRATAAKGGIAVIAADQDEIRAMGDSRRGVSQYARPGMQPKTLSVGTAAANDFVVGTPVVARDSFSLPLRHAGNEHVVRLGRPLPSHYATTLGLAVAIAVAAGMSVPEAIAALEKNFAVPAGRFSAFRGIKNSLLLDSSYNSSAGPAVDCLRALKALKGGGRAVAVMGDMRELGALAAQEHAKVAAELATGIDAIVLVGPLMGAHVAPLLAARGVPHVHFERPADALARAAELVGEGDAVLVKGSQNELFLEKIVEALLADPADAAKLCRRGAFWDAKRAAAYRADS